jgi:hypothetical protein
LPYLPPIHCIIIIPLPRCHVGFYLCVKGAIDIIMCRSHNCPFIYKNEIFQARYFGFHFSSQVLKWFLHA